MRCAPKVLKAGLCVLFALSVADACAQSAAYERTFPQSKEAVERSLKAMQANLAGRLPVLEGFAKPGDHPLTNYQRGYYQATLEVSSTPTGGTVVRVTAKVTAWYADPAGSGSGYQLLTSNGRLEADLLDQLGDQLATVLPESSNRTANNPMPPAQPTTAPAVKTAAPPPATVAATKPASPTQPATSAAGRPLGEPAIVAPAPQFPGTSQTFSSSLSHGIAASQPAGVATAATEKSDSALQAEAESLENTLKGMAHPNNLIAVKKSGTPVVATPSLNAKPQFLASAHDEFELLDFNADWVHVRISGLSRGWIWRNSVEMPEGIPDTADHPATPLTPAADLFHVSREEIAPFPGDWEPLRNKSVKIISVQKIDESAKDTGPKERLEYAKFLMEKSYPEIKAKPEELQGVVVIFDSIDGGMIAATATTLDQWKAGTLSDAALWHKCYFDPPETFDSAPASGSK